MTKLHALCLASALFGCAADSGKPFAADAAAEPEPQNVAEPQAGGPMADAYAALMTANYDALPDLLARLDAELEQAPEQEQGRLALYAGTMRLWHATGGKRTLGEQFNEVSQAIKLLKRGRELRPNDPHIGAFLGIAQVAFGNTTGDEKAMAEGKQTIEDSVPLYPAYVTGVLMQALGMTPREHAFFAEAKAAVTTTFRECGANATQLEELELEYPAGPTQGTCWNGGIVSHVWEGVALVAGDIFVKSGDAAGARRLYENAKAAPNYARWPFKAVLDRRIADADARQQLYVDDVKDNDPLTWMQEGQLCVGCHANEP